MPTAGAARVSEYVAACGVGGTGSGRDPVPIPMSEPEPQVTIPVSAARPWHTQIHRDAFNYGDVPPNVDSRVVIDLRWFGIVPQEAANRVKFSEAVRDTFGMPQPTFEFRVRGAAREAQHAMMTDMLRAAAALGGFLLGSEPQFMPPGLTLHIHGCTRMGDTPADSVCDRTCKVWGYDDLYLGGNSVQRVANASNPTLTSVALAVLASRAMIKDLAA